MDHARAPEGRGVGMTPEALTLPFDLEPIEPNARQAECLEALRWLIVPGDCHDIRRVLLEHNMDRPVNGIATRLKACEFRGWVERCGDKPGPFGKRTTLWRLTT